MLSFLRKYLGRPAIGAVSGFSAQIEVPGLIYAVGDLHGCADLAEALCARIIEDAAGGPATIVFIGDYVDRGEQVRETMDFLLRFAADPGESLETVFLMGNHEQMLLRFLREPESGMSWLASGGLQTLMSYGIGHVGSLRDLEQAEQLRTDLTAALGRHLDFIQALRSSWRSGNVFFAHAGANPAVPIDEQEETTLLWGSRTMLSTPRQDGVWVVHGHYITKLPSAENGRIAVDTGAYASGRLTAARIEANDVRFIQV